MTPHAKIATHIDFAAMTRIFEIAAREGRQFLFEYEVYTLDLPDAVGVETLRSAHCPYHDTRKPEPQRVLRGQRLRFIQRVQ